MKENTGFSDNILAFSLDFAIKARNGVKGEKAWLWSTEGKISQVYWKSEYKVMSLFQYKMAKKNKTWSSLRYFLLSIHP